LLQVAEQDHVSAEAVHQYLKMHFASCCVSLPVDYTGSQARGQELQL